MLMINPYEVTKASLYTTDELNRYWVDINDNEGTGFSGVLKPISEMPMIILGGKGCGKTHLVRYYSYSVFRERHRDDVLSNVLKEKYLGVYIHLGGLNENRFKKNGIAQSIWDHIFLYYMELCIAIETLNVIDTLFHDANLYADKKQEISFCLAVANLLNVKTDKLNTIKHLIEYLEEIRKDIDYKVDNSPFTRSINIETIIAPGNFVFGIPEKLIANFRKLKNIKILYLFDELENIDQNSQKYFQTLIRTAKPFVSIKLSGRLYAIKTLETFCAGERNVEGAEFELLILDDYFRNLKSGFSKFALNLCQRRIEAIYPESPLKSLLDKFDYWNVEDDTDDEGLSSVDEKDRLEMGACKDLVGKELPHLIKLKNNLRSGGISESGAQKIVSTLQMPEYPFAEKFSVFIFYKEWAGLSEINEDNLLDKANLIAQNAILFIDESQYKNSIHYAKQKYFRADIVAQMCKENSSLRSKLKNEYYSGFQTFVKLAGGFPRPLLLLLKSAFAFSAENKNPFFNQEKIPFDIQYRAILKTSHWFYEDATNNGDKQNLQNAIDNIAVFLKDMRYSDNPSECSCISFSFNPQTVSDEAIRILNLARDNSLLFEIISGRKSKNSSIIERMYQLNPLLAPRWELAPVRRGTVPLSGEFVSSIFDFSKRGDYKLLKAERLKNMMAPFDGATRNSSSNKNQLEFKLEF